MVLKSLDSKYQKIDCFGLFLISSAMFEIPTGAGSKKTNRARYKSVFG